MLFSSVLFANKPVGILYTVGMKLEAKLDSLVGDLIIDHVQ
jgi:hypothetical protein